MSTHRWYCRTGDYPTTVESLLNAGVKTTETKPGGTEAVRVVLDRHGIKD